MRLKSWLALVAALLWAPAVHAAGLAQAVAYSQKTGLPMFVIGSSET